MGKVAATYNLMPQDAEIPVEGIKKAIPSVVPEGIRINSMEIKPLAFGLRILEVTFIMEDREGLVDRLEEALHKINGVQNVETISVTLI